MDISSIEKNVPGRGYIWTEQGNKGYSVYKGRSRKGRSRMRIAFACIHSLSTVELHGMRGGGRNNFAKRGTL